MKNGIKVAGVTFRNENEDGGKSRQEILAELVSLNRSIITVDLIYTKYGNDFAIKLREHATKQIIGWIPKDKLNLFKEKKIRQMTGFISNYGIWSVRLFMQEAPTHQEYRYMKYLCNKSGCAMPAYDKRAYKEIFNARYLNG